MDSKGGSWLADVADYRIHFLDKFCVHCFDIEKIVFFTFFRKKLYRNLINDNTSINKIATNSKTGIAAYFKYFLFKFILIAELKGITLNSVDL